MLLTKCPGPVPLLVLLFSSIVGVEVGPQQTPFAFTAAVPSLVTFPPQTAEFEVTDVTSSVVTVGARLQQAPRAVTGVPPSFVTLPPHTASLWPGGGISAVVTSGFASDR